MDTQEKIKQHFINIAVTSAAKAKVAALLGQADANAAVKFALPSPGSVPPTKEQFRTKNKKYYERFTSAEGLFYYSNLYKENELLANEIIRTNGVISPSANLLSWTKMSDIYAILQEKILLFVPHVYYFNGTTRYADLDAYINVVILTRNNGGVSYDKFSVTNDKTSVLFRNQPEKTDLYTNGEELLANYLTAIAGQNAQFKANNATWWGDITILINSYRERTKGKTDPMPNATLYQRLLFLDKVRDNLNAFLQKNKEYDYAKVAVEIVNRSKDTKIFTFADLLMGKSKDFSTKVGIYLFYIAFAEAYPLMNNVGVSLTDGKILLDDFSDSQKLLIEQTPYAKLVIENLATINEQLFPSSPPLASTKPKIPIEDSSPETPDTTSTTPPAWYVPPTPVQKVDTEALLKAQRDANKESQELLVSQNNKAIDALTKSSKESIDAVLANNRAMQEDLLKSTEEIEKARAAEETQRELIRAKEREEAAKIAGATTIEITRLNAESSNEVAIANARAVNAAAERAADAAVGSVKAVLGDNGLPGVLGTISNMLNDSAAQNARMNYEKEQTRQYEAALAAQKAARDMQQITELQYQARADALERERKSSQQIQDLIAKVQTLQKEDPTLVNAKYSQILSKLTANVVIKDKQSCRIEANALQEFNLAGENNTVDGLSMKQRVTVSTSCYQDTQKMINLQEKIKAQIQQFAQVLNPDINTKPPEQWGTNATLDIATNFNTETLQDMISIANGDQKVSITAKNSILKNIVIDQTVDLYTQIVQNTVTQFDVVKEFTDSLDTKVETLAAEQKQKAAETIAKEQAEKTATAAASTANEGTNNFIYWILLTIFLIICVGLLVFLQKKKLTGGGGAERLFPNHLANGGSAFPRYP